MKKILTLVLLTIIAINASAKLTKIDFKWTKIVHFGAIALSEQDFNNKNIGKVDDGKILIKYNHYGSAGSSCTVSIDAGKNFMGTAFDGSKVTRLEDVMVLYDPDDGTLVIRNKIGESLLFVVGGTDLNLLLFFDVVPFLTH